MNAELISPLSIYFCGSEVCAPGHFFGPAVRPHYLLHIVLDGKGIYRRKNKSYQLKKGDAFLIFPLESTYYQADTSDPWTYVWVGFDGQDVDTLLENTCYGESCIYTCPDQKETLSSIRQLTDALLSTFNTSTYNPLTLMGFFLQRLGIMGTEKPVAAKDFSHEYAKRARNYIDNNYSMTSASHKFQMQ